MRRLHIFMAVCALALPAYISAENIDDVLSRRTGMTDWVDPVEAVPDGCRYVLYPSSQRGDSTMASCLVYLPPCYEEDSIRRYPVIYYLHGGTGNQREVRWLTKRVDVAIRNGEMNPVIIVAPQALPIGWYVNANQSDAKVTSGPIADVLIKDLIPYIDSNFRTIADRSGRGVEGFSMGGRGALMLTFRHPDVFGTASSVAGAVVDWEEEPLKRALECTFGDMDNPVSRRYFEAWHPASFACENVREINRLGTKVRMFVGDADRLYDENGNHITADFSSLLDTLGISHTLKIVPGANHNPEEIFDESVNVYDVGFWNEAFAEANGLGNAPQALLEFSKEYFPKQRIGEIITEDDPRGNHYSSRTK